MQDLLAEVLITLGIIGVVAALTMPSLIANYQEKVLETQYKKAKTIITNGYKLMMTKEETYEVPNLSFMQNDTTLEKVSKAHRATFNILKDGTYDDIENLPEMYSIAGEREEAPFNWSQVPYLFVTTDGMLYGLEPSYDLSSFYVFADVNGPKNPNMVKKDLYVFRFSDSGKLSDISELLEGNCSIENPGGCKTEEACRAISSKCPTRRNTARMAYIWYTYWENGTCHKKQCE